MASYLFYDILVYDYSSSSAVENEDPEAYFNTKLKPLLGDLNEKQVYDRANEVAKDENASIFKLEISEGYGHTFDPNKTYYSVMPPKDSIYWDEEIGDNLNKWERRNNCRVDPQTGAFNGPLDSKKPVIYYRIQVCSNCGKEIPEEIQITNPDVTVGDEFIKAGENVKGFVIINEKGVRSFTDAKQIPASYNYEVVRENCNANASIVHITRMLSTDGYPQWIEGKVEWLGSGHTWGKNRACYAWEGYGEDDFSTTGSMVNGRYKLNVDAYEADGTPKVYSKNCITEAYYTFEDKCFGCDTPNDKSGVKMEAIKGSHDWDESTRVTDYSLTTYTKIDDKHHLEHYKDVIFCGLCGKREEVASKKADALVDHKLIPEKVVGSEVPPSCGETGYYFVKDTCVCGYVDNASEKKVIIPATDLHEWESTTPFLEWSGQVYIENYDILGRTFHVDVVRKCKNCGATDSNGINGTALQAKPVCDKDAYDRNDDKQTHYNDESYVPGGKWCANIHVDKDSIIDAKKDLSTGVPYPCATAYANIYVDWTGLVDGNLVTLNEETVGDEAIRKNVPYYVSLAEYQSRTAHTPGIPQKENEVPATLEAEGHYDSVVRCTVCGDIVSKKTVTVPKLEPEVKIPAPTVTAKSANYNTVNITWNAIEGASSYRLYYKSAALGVNSWTLVRNVNGTSFNHTALVTGVKYRYTVRAVVDGKLGEFSKTGSVASPKLSAPVLNSVTSVAKGKKLSWSKVDGASGYIIQKDGKRVATVKGGAKVTWTDKKASAGSTYKVRAYRTVYKANYDKTNVYGPFSAAK